MNRHEKNWFIHYIDLREFVKINNRFPTPYEVYKGFSMGMWCQTQIKKRREGILNDTQLKCLEKIELPVTLKKVEDVSFAEWQKKFELLLEYRDKYSCTPQKDVIYNGVPLGKWWRSVCVSYSTGNISDSRRQLLEKNDLLGKKNKWLLTYNRVKNHKYVYGHLPNVTEDSTLYYWLKRQHATYRKGNLEAYQIVCLRELEPSFLGNDTEWYNMFTKVKNYKKEHGHLPTEKDNLYLYDWLQNQRSNNRLTANQHHMLEIITD